MRSIAIIGTGYVGIAYAISLSERAFRVIGYDKEVARIQDLCRGMAPYEEDGLKEALVAELDSGRLTFTTKLSLAVEHADAVIICVNTPTTYAGRANLEDLNAVVASLQQCRLKEGIIIAIRSTVPPGTSDRIAEALRGLAHVFMTPEFLREGHALLDSRAPSRHVIGADSRELAEHYVRLFQLDADVPMLLTTRVNAELTKLAANSFLGMKIAFANEVANLTETFDGDVRDVLSGIGMDVRIGNAFLQPGIGFGGPCLTKDLRSYQDVAREQGVSAELVAATLSVNKVQPSLVIKKLERALGTLQGVCIGVWGLTFKAGTDDVRHSLALGIIAELVQRGSHVRVYDPKARHIPFAGHVVRVATALEAVQADALLVLTEWPEFAKIEISAVLSRLRRFVIVDGRNILDGERYALAGARYFGVGISSQHLLPIATQTHCDGVDEIYDIHEKQYSWAP